MTQTNTTSVGSTTPSASGPLRLSDIADLVRLPAVLSAPGDALLGAAASGNQRNFVRRLGMAASSSLLYLGGMALNDYADRKVDATERPDRPIPSGRISEAAALRVGQGLLAAGVALGAVAGGWRGLVTGSLVAGSIVTYDFAAKGSPFGAASMSACRVLDVMHGSTSVRSATVPSVIIGAHTYAITKVSGSEVEGGDMQVAVDALGATTAVASAAALRTRKPAALAFAGLYAVPFGRAAYEALDDPSPRRLQRVVGTGVKAMIPLQGSLIAKHSTLSGAAVASLWGIGKILGQRRSVT